MTDKIKKASLLVPFLCFILLGCEKTDTSVMPMISAHGADWGALNSLEYEFNGKTHHGYEVFIYKGHKDVSTDMLDNPWTGVYKHSDGMFFESIPEGDYTIIVDVFTFHGLSAYRNAYYGMAYTHITYKYSNPSTTPMTNFGFKWPAGVDNYEENGIFYVDLRVE